MYSNFGWKYLLTAAIAILWGSALWWNNGVPEGLDLSGGVELIYRLDFGGKAPSAKLTDDTVDVLRERIDKLGIKELSIRSLGMDKVVIQVPSATDSEIEKIKMQLERAGKLQFKIMVTNQLDDTTKKSEIDRVAREKKLGIWKENDRFDVAMWHSVRGASAEKDRPGDYALLYNYTPSGKPEFVDGKFLANVTQAYDDKGRPCVGFEWNSVGTKAFYELSSNNKGNILAVVLDGEIRSAPVIRAAIGKKGIIEGGDEGWNPKELRSLIVILRAGALPAKPILAYTKRVGPQLGEQAKTLGGGAILGALLVVVVFMMVYYRVRTGFIADVALALNLFLILGTLAMFGGTLTLPGIAGILLTAGMAVDANILIFERIREENERGAALKQAIQAGYDRAFWTIFDANLTTALTALVLMWAGTGPIKGFGLTLTIGIIVSMFTALFVTRAIYGFFVVKEIITEVNFRQLFARPEFDFYGANKKAVTVSLTFIAVGWLVFLARGDKKLGIDFTGGTVIQMRLKTPLLKDQIDERIAAHFKQAGHRVNVEVQRLGEPAEPGTEKGREWKLRTRLVSEKGGDERQSSSLMDAVLPKAYGQQGDPAPAEPPAPAPAQPPAPAAAASSPAPAAGHVSSEAQDYFEQEIRALFEKELVHPYPLIDGKEYVTGQPDLNGKVRAKFKVNLVALAKGIGAAPTPPGREELMATIPPALRALADLTDTKTTVGLQRKEILLALAGPAGGTPGFDVELIPDADPNDGLTPVLFTTHRIENLDKPLQDAVATFKGALEKIQEDEQISFTPSQPFPNIDTVGSAVAKNLQSKAIIATFFCVVFICLYVWLRFDLWSGIAAIVAVFHDVLCLMGFLAILDVIVDALHIPFDAKFNLPTISAFLTLVGYSINDTIVILDRIREDRSLSKKKEYTPELVNSSINKTLMRTVLTSVTTLLVCMVLFGASMGGLDAIQGLSIALLFGIVVGTYSSVFVAAPILLADKGVVRKVLAGLAAYMLITKIAATFIL